MMNRARAYLIKYKASRSAHANAFGAPRAMLFSTTRPRTSGLGAVVFDMDGTLTQEGALDYEEMYRRAGAPLGCKNLLEWVQTLDVDGQKRANAAIQEVEREGYERQLLNPNCVEMLRMLKDRDLRLGILTRNTDEAISFFLKKFDLNSLFDATISRSWPDGECKPAPDALLHMAKLWSIQPSQLMMVGDWKDDIAAGKAAGAITCLKELGSGAQRHNEHLKSEAMYSVHDLMDIPSLVDTLQR